MKRFKFLLTLTAVIPTLIFANNLPQTNSQMAARQAKINTTSSAPVVPSTPVIVPPAPILNAKSYVLMDAQTGKIIAAKNMNIERAPASLTKLMSLYLVFSALHSGQIQLNSKVLISKKAWQTGGSRMFVRIGTLVPIKDLIQGVIVDSGNDAVTALSQFVGGTEATFVEMMNEEAKKLGMSDTHFEDATGLPVKNHYSTAYNLALLTRAIIKNFPEYYHFFDQKWFTYDHIRQPNRNQLLWWDKWVDGLKTGHTKEAGYCLITSGVQEGTRLISVVMGTPTNHARQQDSQALLDYGFRFFTTHKLYAAGATIATPRILYGQSKTTPMGVAHTLAITIPKGNFKFLKYTINFDPKLHAPIVKGNTYGTLTISLNGEKKVSVPLVALANNKEGSLWTRMLDHIGSWISDIS